LTFLSVASVLRIAADSLIETASPPGSSEEELIRNPLESLCKLLCKFTFVLLTLYDAAMDAIFVFMLIMFVFLYLFAASALLSGRFDSKCSTSLFSDLIPNFRFAFHKSLSKSTTKNALTQVHDIEAFQSECTYLPSTRLAFFRIHVFIRVLAPLSALSFASAFNWTRGFHWLGVPFGGLQLPYFIFLLVIFFLCYC
jgi:hypothetical protein